MDVAASGGICVKTGTGTADGPCDSSNLYDSSRCIAGYNCIPEAATDGGTNNVCRKLCDFWGTPTCASGEYCDAYWMVCDAAGESTAIGGTCTGADGTQCAPTGGKYSGQCVNGTCETWCRMSVLADCSNGLVCTVADPNFPNVGTCETAPLPPPDGWTCAAGWYADGYCDCNCGAWDTDCNDLANPQMDCGTDGGTDVCVAVGVCGQPGSKDASTGG
jgi:hypothetical protein